jgi:hypothetical protein
MKNSHGMFDSLMHGSEDGQFQRYLFEAEGNSQPIFYGVTEEMAQLNDFCMLCLDATSSHLAKLKDAARRYSNREEIVEHPDFGDVTDMAEDGLREIEIPRWKDTEEFMVRAMCLVLLSAFLENSLKAIAKVLRPPDAPPFKRKGAGGEIDAVLSYLRSSCGLEFVEQEASRTIREKCRAVRNSFAHGQWEKVRKSLADVSLPEAFLAASQLFRSIDQASAIP